MRKIFTPLLLIPGFIVFFACSKHESPPLAPPTPIDSTNPNVYADPGSLDALVGNDSVHSFKLLHAFDTGGSVNITARTLFNNDTCAFNINFPDTLRTNIAYTNNLITDTTYIGGTSFTSTKGTYSFSVNFYDTFLGIMYLTGIKDNYAGDTLVITTFDRSRHILAGTFKAIMSANAQQNPSITQTTYVVSASFNTYYNSAK